MIGASKAATTRSYQVLSTTNITSTGSQDYTVPAGVVYLEIEMYGGGGGGGGGKTTSGGKGGGTTHYNGGGGGGGAYVKHKLFSIPTSTHNAVINFTVGAGGAGGDGGSSATSGSNGADTTLNTVSISGVSQDISGPVAGGGEGGVRGQLLNTGLGDGGVASNGNITNTNGSDGTNPSFFGGGSALNGAVGGDAGGPDGGDGAAGGSTTSGSATADAGAIPGGGGGGGASTSAINGGGGSGGRVIVKAYG